MAKRRQRCFSLGANATPGMGSSRSCRAGSDEAGGESHGTVAATSAPPSLQGAYPNGTTSGGDCCAAGVSPCSVRDRELGRTKLSSWAARGPQLLSFPKPELPARWLQVVYGNPPLRLPVWTIPKGRAALQLWKPVPWGWKGIDPAHAEQHLHGFGMQVLQRHIRDDLGSSSRRTWEHPPKGHHRKVLLRGFL